MNHSLSPVKMETNETDVLDVTSSVNGKSTISVHSSGEVTTLPDVIQFTITVESSKENAEDAQASVKRRTDYITQVIRKNGVKSNDVTVSTEVSKESVVQKENTLSEVVTVHCDVVVECDSLLKCETIRNLLIEKMDSSVQFSPVRFWHSPEAKQTGRQEAFKRAVVSAKAKAECVSQTVGVQLGSAVQLKEISQDSSTVVPVASTELSDTNQLSASLHQKHLGASLMFSSKVFVCFETQPLSKSSRSKH